TGWPGESKILPFGSTAGARTASVGGAVLPPAPASAALDFSAPAPGSAGARRASPMRQGVVAAVRAAIGVVGAALLVTRTRAKVEAPAPAPVSMVASLSLVSDPPGAQIIIDGDPSGLQTPSTLKGLHAGRPLEVRVDKVGFQPAIEKLELK